jgi:hypothetical protein
LSLFFFFWPFSIGAKFNKLTYLIILSSIGTSTGENSVHEFDILKFVMGWCREVSAEQLNTNN